MIIVHWNWNSHWSYHLLEMKSIQTNTLQWRREQTKYFHFNKLMFVATNNPLSSSPSHTQFMSIISSLPLQLYVNLWKCYSTEMNEWTSLFTFIIKKCENHFGWTAAHNSKGMRMCLNECAIEHANNWSIAVAIAAATFKWICVAYISYMCE